MRLWDAWSKFVIGLFFSTVLGFLGAISLMTLIPHGCRRWHLSRARRVFGRLQVLSAALMASGHGHNDGQRFIGVFTVALALGRVLPDSAVPWWVIVVCTAIMGVEAVRRLSAVRWSLVGNAAMGWILTFPNRGLIADVTALILRWSA